MLQNTKHLIGYKLATSGCDIGHIKDFYFDDKSWAVRYAVVDTGTWLTGRLVLLAPRAFGRLDVPGERLFVDLTAKQIEDSPPIESDRPVSRQYEEQYHGYYGWPVYWDGGGMLGAAGFPVVAPPMAPVSPPPQDDKQGADPHLRSAQAVVGHSIEANDGAIGSVSGFMVDDQGWAIRELVVETGHWFAGKEIRISPGKVTRISYEEAKVFVNLTKADIQQTAEDELAHAGAGNRAPENSPKS